MLVKTGQYTGDGNTTLAVTGVGFQPHFVMVKSRTTAQVASIRTSDMGTNESKPISNLAVVTDGVRSLDADGFTVGNNARVNANTVVYDYVAVRNDGNSDFAVGTYTGNGGNPSPARSTGFLPTCVIVMSATTDQPVIKFAAGQAAGNASEMGTSTGDVAVWDSLNATDFKTQDDAQVNTNAVTYYWAAWKLVSGAITSGTYTGNGSDNRDIDISDTSSSADFLAEFVTVFAPSGESAVFYPDVETGDFSLFYAAGGGAANYIQDLIGTTGFQVSNSVAVNGNLTTYYYFAMKDNVAPVVTSRPAFLLNFMQP